MRTSTTALSYCTADLYYSHRCNTSKPRRKGGREQARKRRKGDREKERVSEHTVLSQSFKNNAFFFLSWWWCLYVNSCSSPASPFLKRSSAWFAGQIGPVSLEHCIRKDAQATIQLLNSLLCSLYACMCAEIHVCKYTHKVYTYLQLKMILMLILI